LVHELFTKAISDKLFGEEPEKSNQEVVDTPVTIECDEILLILGPSLKYMNNHENNTFEDELDDHEESMEDVHMDSYDTLHYLKVIESRLKHRLHKQKKQERLERKKQAKLALQERRKRNNESEYDPESIVKNLTLLLKILNISVSKIHIRYEEDYFVSADQYSFGLVINSVNLRSFDKDIKFKTPIDVTYEEFYPTNKQNLQLKKLEISDIRIYWNTKSETYIPNSLQEMTRGHRQQIFEAMDVDILRDLMLQVFDHVEKDQKYLYGNARFPGAKFQYLIDSFSVDAHVSYYNISNSEVHKLQDHRFRMGLCLSPLKFSFTPSVLRDLQNMIEFVENYYILHELQVFKPISNVITQRNSYDYRNKRSYSRTSKRNIIRQWFQYVIWSNRIKKVLQDKPCIELIDLEIISRKDHYSSMLNKIRANRESFFKLDPRALLKDEEAEKKILKIAHSVLEEFEQSKKQKQLESMKKYYHEFLQRIFINFRFQEIYFGKLTPIYF